MKVKGWVLVGAVGAIIALGVILFAQRQAREQITIGWIGPLTGDAAPYGKAIQKGTQLAVEEINQQGGINGRKIEVIYEDDQATPRFGVAAMNKFVSAKLPLVIQAAASSVMLANIPIAEKNKVVYISPSCSNEKIKDGGDYIFRIWPADSDQGRFIANFSYANLNARKAAVIYINNDFGIGLKEVFTGEFQRLGGKVVASETFNAAATDFRAQLTRIKSLNPEMIFMPSHVVEAARVLKQAKELGVKAQFISDAAAFSPELLKNAGEAAGGLLVTNLEWDFNSQDHLVKDFVVKFEKTHGEKPDIYAAKGYDLVRVITKAFREGGTSSQEIRDALAKISGFPGVAGEVTFDEYGEVHANYSIYKVQGQAFVPLKK